MVGRKLRNTGEPKSYQQRQQTRKWGYCADKPHQNLILMFGCRPAKTVMADTKLIYELSYTFENNYDKNTLTLKIPDVLTHMSNKDAKTELLTSNTLQTLNLILSHNIITDTIAYIFINTECKGAKYPNAHDKGSTAFKIFNEILSFSQVSCFVNLSKRDIVEKMAELKKHSETFEKK